MPVAIYVGVACFISGVSALLAHETKEVELAAIRRAMRDSRNFRD